MQIKLPKLEGDLTADSLKPIMENLQRGLEFRTYTPTLTNMATPASKKAAYQVCGKACHVTIYLDYTGITPNWTATPYITLPIKVTTNTSNVMEPNLSIVEDPTRTLISWTRFDYTNLNRVSLPVRAGSAGEKFIISGFYWID